MLVLNVVHRAGDRSRVERLRAVHDLAQLAVGAAQQQRAVQRVEHGALLAAHRVDDQAIGLAAAGSTAVQDLVLIGGEEFNLAGCRFPQDSSQGAR